MLRWDGTESTMFSDCLPVYVCVRAFRVRVEAFFDQLAVFWLKI